MKISNSATFAALFASAGLMSAATNDLTSLIQRGLFEEEANHNLEAAMRAYQAAVDGIDKDRQLDATAVFRLGECWRKLGKTNEANLQYQRILREFPDQTNLTKLCSEYLGGANASNPFGLASNAKDQEVQTAYNGLKVKLALIEGELALVTNMSRTDMESYFTTVKPDGALQTLEGATASAEAALNEFNGKGYGPLSAEVASRKSSLDSYKQGAVARVDALLRNLQVEAELLHKQGDTLRSLLNQSNLFSPAVAASPDFAPLAEDEQVRKIKEMIRNSPDLINGSGPDGGYTPLQMAVRMGNVAATELLLANGAELNGTSRMDGNTPLGIAAEAGNKAMIELLLDKGADVNGISKAPTAGSIGETPLHRAAAKGFKTVVEFLLAHKADVNARNSAGATPLHIAARSGFLNVAELLLSNHAEVNARDKQGQTALFPAVENNHLEMVQLLLANKAEVNAVDSQNLTPLFRAVLINYPEIVQLLLANKAEVNPVDKEGRTPLLAAVLQNHPEIVRILLANKADLNMPNNQGWAPLFDAVNNNHPELVQLLLANKADANVTFKPGVTPLLLATSKNDIDIGLVKSLLQNGADTQAHIPNDGNGWNNINPGKHALDLAVQSGRTNVLELLLESHADPNATFPQYPFAPLLLAELNSYGNAAESFKILLDHGADPDLGDQEGQTPLIHAVMDGKIAIVQELLDHHADVNKPDNQGRPPLAFVQIEGPSPLGSIRMPREARRQNDPAIKALLLKAGANEDFQRLGRIFITQKGTGSIGSAIFHKDASSFNHYTLFELIAEAYQGNARVSFPDFAHVTINRLRINGAKEEIAVNLDEMLKTADCSKDPALEWGDIVQIPQLDHLVNEGWGGFTREVEKSLGDCLARKVEIIVKGQITKIALVSRIAPTPLRMPGPQRFPGAREPGFPNSAMPEQSQLSPSQDAQPAAAKPFSLASFSLNEVVHGANVLLLSSDLTRVKVTRNGAPMTFNLEPPVSSDLWLRDGDVIEIPERETDTPASK